MAQTTSNMKAALVQTVEEISRRLVQQQRFATALESFQQELLHDLERTKNEGQSYLARFTKDFGLAAQNLLLKISSATSSFEMHLNKLGNVLSLVKTLMISM